MRTIILNILKGLGMVGTIAAPVLVQQYVPALAPLVTSLVNSIVTAEAKVGSGGGVAKQELVGFAVQSFSPLIVSTLEDKLNKQAENPDLLATGLSKVQEGFVDILNAFGTLPKKVA